MRKRKGFPATVQEKASSLVNRALKLGILVRPKMCEICSASPEPGKNGRSRIQGHHDDYSKILEVRWLCTSCHIKWHFDNGPAKGAELSSVVRLLSRDIDRGCRIRSVKASYKSIVESLLKQRTEDPNKGL